jgi:sugar phosphate isomerase/epimerase
MADAFAVLKSVGFDGYVSMEIDQKPNSIVAAETSYKVISYLINNLL